MIRSTTRRCGHCGQPGHNKRTCIDLKERKERKKEERKAIKAENKRLKAELGLWKNESTCTICYSEIEGKKDSMCLPCGHEFHTTCAMKWFRENNTCPVCRAECGEKIKKKNGLTQIAAMGLTQETLNHTDFHHPLDRIKETCHKPWNNKIWWSEMDKGPVLPRAYVPRSVGLFSTLPESEKKYIWEGYTEGQKKTRINTYLLEMLAGLIGNSMMDVLRSAAFYLDGDLDLDEVLVSDGAVTVEIPSDENSEAPASLEEIAAIPGVVIESETEDEEDDEMPPLEPLPPPLVRTPVVAQPSEVELLSVEQLYPVDNLLRELSELVPQMEDSLQAGYVTPPPSSPQMPSVNVTRRTSQRIAMRQRRQRLINND